MHFKPAPRAAILAAVTSLAVAGPAVLPGAAGAVTPTKSELKNGQLRLEGQSFPGVFVTASSTTSVADIRADGSGHYKIQAAGFTAPDCRVTISDGRTPTATATLAGCTPSVTPVPITPAPPTGSCVITPAAPVTLSAGASSAVFFQTTGCNTTFNSGATPTPVQWTLVAGAIPTGMTGPVFQGLTAGGIMGTPSIRGTYRFTLRVTDQVGATDEETFTVTVA